MFKTTIKSLLLASFSHAQELATPKTLHTINLEDEQFNKVLSFLSEALKDVVQNNSKLLSHEGTSVTAIEILVSNLASSWLKTRLKEKCYIIPVDQWTTSSAIIHHIGSDLLLSLISSLKLETVFVKFMFASGDISGIVDLFSDIRFFSKRQSNKYSCLTFLLKMFNVLVDNLHKFPLLAQPLLHSSLEYERLAQSITSQILEVYSGLSMDEKELVIEKIVKCCVQFINLLLLQSFTTTLNVQRSEMICVLPEIKYRSCEEGKKMSEIMMGKLFLSENNQENNVNGFVFGKVTHLTNIIVDNEETNVIADILKIIITTTETALTLTKDTLLSEKKSVFIGSVCNTLHALQREVITKKNLQERLALQEKLPTFREDLKTALDKCLALDSSSSVTNPCYSQEEDCSEVTNHLVSYWSMQESLVDWEDHLVESLVSNDPDQSSIALCVFETVLPESIYCSPTLIKRLYNIAANLKTDIKSTEHGSKRERKFCVVSSVIKVLQNQCHIDDVNDVLYLCSEYYMPENSVLWLAHAHEKKTELIKLLDNVNEVLNKIVDLDADVSLITELGRLCIICPFDILRVMVKRGCSSTVEGQIIAGLLKKLYNFPELTWFDNAVFLYIRDAFEDISPSHEEFAANFIEALLVKNFFKMPASEESPDVSSSLIQFIDKIILPNLQVSGGENNISTYLVLLVLSKLQERMMQLGETILLRCMFGVTSMYASRLTIDDDENSLTSQRSNCPSGEIRDLVHQLLSSFVTTLCLQLKTKSVLEQQSVLVSISELLNGYHWIVSLHFYVLFESFSFPSRITIPKCLVRYFHMDANLQDVFKTDICLNYSSTMAWLAYFEICKISEDTGKFLSECLNPTEDNLDDFIKSLSVIMATSTQSEWSRVFKVLRYLLVKMRHTALVSLAHNQLTLMYPSISDVHLTATIVANALFLAFKNKSIEHTAFRTILLRFVEVISQLIDEVMNAVISEDQRKLNLSMLFHYTGFVSKKVKETDEITSLMVGLVNVILETIDKLGDISEADYWKLKLQNCCEK